MLKTNAVRFLLSTFLAFCAWGSYAVDLPKPDATELERKIEQAVAQSGPQSLAVANAARDLGNYWLAQRQPLKAISPFERSLAIRRQLLGDGKSMAFAMGRLGTALGQSGQHEKRAPLLKEAIAILDRDPDATHADRANARMDLAATLTALGDLPAAVDAGTEAVAQFAKIPPPRPEHAVWARTSLGAMLRRQGRLEDAIEEYRKALGEAAETPTGTLQRLDAHRALARIHADMSFVESSLEHAQQALLAAEASGNRLLVARERAVLATIHEVLFRQHDRASALAHEALAALRPEDMGSRQHAEAVWHAAQVIAVGKDKEEAARVTKLAMEATETAYGANSEEMAWPLVIAATVASRSADYAEQARLLRRAVELHQRRRQGGCSSCAITHMINLSYAEERLGNEAEATALRRRAVFDALRADELLDTANALLALGSYHAKRRELDTAIFLGKRSLNALQSLRARMSGLQLDLQMTFAEGREGMYRKVAGWMVDAGRLSEAQQALDMLKDAELAGFLRGQGPAAKQDPLALSGTERGAQGKLDEVTRNVVRLASELAALRRRGSGTLAEPEKKRGAEIEGQLEQARLAFDGFISQLSQRFEQASPQRNREVGEMQLERLVAMRRTLAELGEGVVMLHYVVTPERLVIILTTPSVQVARVSPIAEEALNRAVFELRSVLQDPARDVLPAAKRFYDIAIAPVARDLEDAGARTLMLSLDGALRYVPFAALHDGERFLAARYATAIFTAAARDKLKDKPRSGWRMMGLGVTQAHAGFSALPSVRSELEAIRGGVYPGEVYLDAAFTAQRLQDSLDKGFALLHIASHFRFSPAGEADSFLLLGDGSRLSLRDVRRRNLDFGAVDLVTLSACDTAMGGGRDDSGREVEGLGAMLQNQGAKGVLASLWPVADESTARLMWTFYSARSGPDGSLTKAEALRRAQLNFIARSGVDGRLAHPFHWAPFILMGNWL